MVGGQAEDETDSRDMSALSIRSASHGMAAPSTGTSKRSATECSDRGWKSGGVSFFGWRSELGSSSEEVDEIRRSGCEIAITGRAKAHVRPSR